MANSDQHTKQLLNSLRVNERELAEIVQQLQEGAPENAQNSGRQHTRFDFLQQVVIFEIEHPGGNRVEIPVASVNLSRQGIGLVHSSYVHTGSRCTIKIRQEGQRPLNIPGEVIRCIYRTGRIHEIGVRFDEEIDARAILSLNSMSESWSRENVDPSLLAGRVLVVDDDDLICRLVEGLLKSTSLQVQVAKTTDEAIEKIAGCDLILCDYYLDKETGDVLVERLRQEGYTTPVIMMTSESTPEIRERIESCGANSFISKPLNRDSLMRAFAEFLLGTGPADPLESTLGEEDGRRELIPAFRESLERSATELEEGIKADDRERIEMICKKVQDGAASLGFDSLCQMARDAVDALEQSESTKAAMPKLSQLAGVFRQANAKAA